MKVIKVHLKNLPRSRNMNSNNAAVRLEAVQPP